jgi:hypothetical protein
LLQRGDANTPKMSPVVVTDGAYRLMDTRPRKTEHSAEPWRPGATLLGTLALAALASIALRYGLMESDALHTLCASSDEDWRCLTRRWAPQIFMDQRIGWLALAAGALSWLPAGTLARRALAVLALVSGVAGLVLYSADFAAAGLLLGLITLMSGPASRTGTSARRVNGE